MLARRLLTVAAILGLLSAACTRRPVIQTPATARDAVGRSLDLINATLGVAVQTYQEQRDYCAVKDTRCRFSPEGLQGFRHALLRANDSFTAAVHAYEAWVTGGGSEETAQATLAVARSDLLVVEGFK